jgi:hypothetical protein
VLPPRDGHGAIYTKIKECEKEYVYMNWGNGCPGSTHREVANAPRVDLSDPSIEFESVRAMGELQSIEYC